MLSATCVSDFIGWMQSTNDPLLNGPIASPYYNEAKRQLLGGSI
jgi:hypothetical protein